MKKITTTLCMLALPMALMSANTAQADYPRGNINLIVPYSAGGSTDQIARLFAQKVGGKLKDKIIVLNKPGASGIIGEIELAKSKPDGYTLLVTGRSTVVNQILQKNTTVNYDDILPLAGIASSPFLVLTNPDAVNSMEELKAADERDEHGVRAGYTSDAMKLLTWAFADAIDIKMPDAIAYPGGPQVHMALMRGDIDFTLLDEPSSAALVQGGRLSAVANTSPERTQTLPSVPTTVELGYGSFAPLNWHGLFIKTGTPQEIQTLIQGELRAFMRDPEVLERLAQMGATPMLDHTENFADYVNGEVSFFSEIAAKYNTEN